MCIEFVLHYILNFFTRHVTKDYIIVLIHQEINHKNNNKTISNALNQHSSSPEGEEWEYLVQTSIVVLVISW